MSCIKPCTMSPWRSPTTPARYLTTTRSTASGAIHADVEPGAYRLILARDGYGPKRSRVITGQPAMIRMLSDTLYGYVWPKWSVAGDTAELRIHSPEPYRATLWRYGYRREPVGLLGWFDEHGPQAMRQVLPDHDLARDGAGFNGTGFTSPGHVRRVIAPDRSGLYYVQVETPSGRQTSFPVGGRPGPAGGRHRGAGRHQQLERLQPVRRPEQLHQRGGPRRRRRWSAPGRTCRAM